MRKNRLIGVLELAALVAAVAVNSAAQDTGTEPKATETKPADKAAAPANEAQELAKKLSNPVANLISVPLQSNFDCNIGPADDGCRFTMNLQPVIPISIADDWNVISRTILPITYQNDIFPGAGDQFELGDTVQSFFFSPKDPRPSAGSSGVSARRFCCRPARTNFSAAKSSASAPPRSFSSRPATGRSAR